MPKPLPEFDRPPLDEVVLGVQFEPLEKFRSGHLGLYWSRVKSRYPTTDDQPPLLHIKEKPEVEPQQPPTVMLQLPSIPRCWFVDESKTLLIQLQQDRFIRNWRQVEGDEAYPRFPRLAQDFRREWEVFLAFLSDENLGEAKVNQCELTYVNNVERGSGWNELSDLPKVFSLLRAPKEGGFLPPPELMSWELRYKLPDGRGRLRAQMTPVFRARDMKMALQLNLTVRGAPAGASPEQVFAWFDLAHEWAVRGFCELTEPSMRQLWGEKS